MKYGLLALPKDIRDFVTGEAKMPWIEYNETGDFEKNRTKHEKQAVPAFDTYNCTGFGSTDAIENFIKYVYGVEENYSDRWVGIIAGTKAYQGNDPVKVFQAIREYGLIPEKMLPFDDSIKTPEEYFSFKGADKEKCYAEGRKWLEKHDLRYELLWSYPRPENYVELITEALKTSPVGVSVDAWRDENNIFVNFLPRNNHWTLGINHKDGAVRVKDTYIDDNTDIKQLAKDHNIQKAIRIWVNRRTKPAMRRHVSLLETILKNLKLMKPTLTDVIEMNLGKDPTPHDDTIPGGVKDDVACVASGTTILRAVYPEVPKEVSTIKMNEWFSAAKNWRRVDEPEAEAVIISPTEGTKIGHMGFCMEDGTIASNNSFGVYKGKLTKNYTFATWNKYYKDKQGLKVYMYKRVV